jgi:uncharacterized membrane protein
MNHGAGSPAGSSPTNARIVYILYLISLAFGITGIIGVVLAYVDRGSGPEWLESHRRYQIRTFWIGGLYILIGTVLSVILVGFLVILFWIVWLVVRCVKGMNALDAEEPVENVESWFF